tara:strand:+ start:790 stop:1533 length:744 start_codon:yes stop_codon:yes gene_type:complete
MFDFDALVILIKKLNKDVEEIKITDFDVDFKLDNSPLTKADLHVNRHLSDFVHNSNCKNIISEEISNLEFEERKSWRYYWVIDPIDGTKEFINKSTDYTINIALCHEKEPIFGLVSCPATNDIYYAYKNKGAFLNGKEISISTETDSNLKRVIASKSHINAETTKFIEDLKKNYEIDVKNYGSSLKICKIAEGKADIYPRFGPTMEWDTCAAQIILEEAGGSMLDKKNLKLTYNKADLRNPFFIASS